MDIYTIEQIETILDSEDFRHVCLCDAQGDDVIKYNPNTIPVGKRWDQIKKKLKSDVLADGVYCVKMKTNIQKNTKEFPFYTEKGNTDTTPSQVDLTPKKTLSDPFPVNGGLSVAEIIDLKSENRILADENNRLKQEVDDLTQQVDELQDEIDKQPATLQEGEGMNSTIKGITDGLQSFIPVLDRKYDMEEKRIALEEARLALWAQTGVTPPGVNQPQAQGPDQPTPPQPKQTTEVEAFNFLTQQEVDQLDPEQREVYMQQYWEWLERNHPETYMQLKQQQNGA